MKQIIFFSAIIFLFSFVCASPEILLQKENYQAQETLIGIIDGTISTISKDNIKIYEDRRELSLDKNVFYYDNKYYFYVILPKEGNFRIEVKNLLYKDNEALKSKDIVKNISVRNILDEDNKTSILSIRPGVIESAQNSSTIYITNFGSNNLTVRYYGKEILLQTGKSEKIELLLNKSFDNFLIDSYEDFVVPTIYSQIIENQTSYSKNITINLTSNIDNLIVNIFPGQREEYNFSLINLGDSLDNLSIRSTSSSIDLTSKITKLENNSVENVYFKINIGNEIAYNSSLIVYYNESKILELPIQIYIFENESALNSSSWPYKPVQKDCSSIGGKLCASNENCEGDFTEAGGLCCFGSCTYAGEKPANFANILFGIVIFILVFLSGYYFYKKVKNAKLPSADEKIRNMSNTKN